MSHNLDKNYFDLFGISNSFDIDRPDLTKRYHDLQRQFHPDKYTNASDQERRLSMQITAQINEALQTLTDPVRRGRYLLKLAGVDFDDETDTKMDPEFLMEQIEFRERLEAIERQPDPQLKLAELVDQVEKRQRLRLDELRDLFLELSQDDSVKAKMVLRELQFLQKVSSEIEEMEEQLA